MSLLGLIVPGVIVGLLLGADSRRGGVRPTKEIRSVVQHCAIRPSTPGVRIR